MINKMNGNFKIIKLPVERWLEYKQLRLEALKLEPTAFGLTPEEKDKNSEDDWKRDLEEFLVSKKQVCYFVEMNDKLVGMAGAYKEKGVKIAHIAIIFGVYIRKEFRGQGIAKKLLQTLLDELESKDDIVKLNLDVTTTHQSAINLYKGFGFEIVGELKKEYLVDGKFYGVYEMEKYLS